MVEQEGKIMWKKERVDCYLHLMPENNKSFPEIKNNKFFRFCWHVFPL